MLLPDLSIIKFAYQMTLQFEVSYRLEYCEFHVMLQALCYSGPIKGLAR